MKEQLIRFREAAPVLPSLNFKETTDFYTQKLGFKLIGQYPDYLIFERDAVSLHFWFCNNPDIPKQSGCYIYVENIEEIYLEFDKQGVVHPNGALKNTSYGIKEFAALDIHGNLLRIGELMS